MKVAFVCVNYNNYKVTMNYIHSALNIVGSFDVRIIVVDNASRNEDLFLMEKSINELNGENVVLVKSSSNVGYFGGLNLGIRWALEHGYNQFQIVGNNDIIFASDFLTNLEKLELNNDELILAPDIITSDNSHENPHVVSKMSWARKLKYEIYFSNYYVARAINLFYSAERKEKAFDPNRKHIYMGIGALYVLTPFFFKHFTSLWNLVFLYGEEAILAGQIQSVSGKILYDPILRCYHEESSTTSKLQTKVKFNIIRKSYSIYKKYL